MSDVPAEVFCLAEIVCDELLARGWTTRTLAARMSDKRDFQMRVLELDLWLANGAEEGIIIDDEMFASLAAALGMSPAFFRNIHSSWIANFKHRSPFECPENVLSKF